MLIDNINYLRKYHRSIREYFKDHEEDILNEPYNIIDTKAGQPTLQTNLEDKAVYIHSKYDPINEADLLAGKYKDEINQYQHVFFYGIGMGYVVEAFARHYPDISFTLYEPCPAVFYHFLSQRKIEELPLKKIKNIQLETSEQDRITFLSEFANQLDENVLLVTIPSYERIFKKRQNDFLNQFTEKVKNKRSDLNTNLAFEKRWTINSIINFPEVLKTPNILTDIDKIHFKNKPAIIVSAGPSLNEEMENLRFIKENKSAYVFSVGSAINSLIENGIHPDAAFTYDPKVENQFVFEKLVKGGIDTIPLVYGSSVGFETLQSYLGPKVHFITSQDTVSSFYLNADKARQTTLINDAPSIAVITLQVLAALGCNPIILVGQNLGYKGKKTYADGISYNHASSYLNDKDLESALNIEATDGSKILTNESFVGMRKQLEMYIGIFKNIKVINTTKGGAVIKGTEYVELEKLINNNLLAGVVEDWNGTQSNQYDKSLIKQHQDIMDREFTEINNLLSEMKKVLTGIQHLINNNAENEIDGKFHQFDKVFNSFKKNKFYATFLEPMVRVEYEITKKKIQSVKFDNDLILKGKNIVNIFVKFLYDCQQNLVNIYQIYEEMRNSLKSLS